MNGTNTLVGPGSADAAVLRIKGTFRALALAIDGPGPARLGDLDPYLAGASAVIEGALNVACVGARPIGITDCLNFGSPETPAGSWQLREAIDGMAAACTALGIPVVSGNVSLYNETSDGPILPTPVVGTVGLVEDRSRRVGIAWSDGDELWLLGDAAVDAGAVVASELAWRRGMRGGRPTLGLSDAARVVRLLPELIEDGVVEGAHDPSVGGLATALARMAIASQAGAEILLPAAAGRVPTAALFGERTGRVVVVVRGNRGRALRERAAAAGVAAVRIGVAGGDGLRVELPDGPLFEVSLAELRGAYATPLTAP
jgi:phosphoribosylformylglycinamidine (FGAM) synthase-like enzyme